jgi:hypothetical protein
MSAATVALIVEAIANLAPYLAQLGVLAGKARAGEMITESDMAAAEAARRRAFASLRGELSKDLATSH